MRFSSSKSLLLALRKGWSRISGQDMRLLGSLIRSPFKKDLNSELMLLGYLTGFRTIILISEYKLFV